MGMDYIKEVVDNTLLLIRMEFESIKKEWIEFYVNKTTRLRPSCFAR